MVHLQLFHWLTLLETCPQQKTFQSLNIAPRLASYVDHIPHQEGLHFHLRGAGSLSQSLILVSPKVRHPVSCQRDRRDHSTVIHAYVDTDGNSGETRQGGRGEELRVHNGGCFGACSMKPVGFWTLQRQKTPTPDLKNIYLLYIVPSRRRWAVNWRTILCTLRWIWSDTSWLRTVRRRDLRLGLHFNGFTPWIVVRKWTIHCCVEGWRRDYRKGGGKVPLGLRLLGARTREASLFHVDYVTGSWSDFRMQYEN
jgi:hypothetical protein